MTQSQVAERANINEKYYGELERDESSPTVNCLEKICLALGVKMQQIVSYRPIKNIYVPYKKEDTHKMGSKFYCNCCGTDFFSRNKNVFCPECGCEYEEEREYIEKYE